jgi:RNA polymerase sigma factor for flagellar operon FliA
MADDPLKDPDKQKKLNHFLAEHAPLINLHLKKLHREGKIHQDIDHTDLHEAGFHGLMEALHRYDPKIGASFGTYAGTRIRGKMLDHITSSGPVPKSLQTQAKNLKALQAQKKPETPEE